MTNNSDTPLGHELLAARENLRRALIQGGDTGAARARLEALERMTAEAARQQVIADMEQRARDTEQLQQRVDTLALEATRRLDDLLMALKAPQPPSELLAQPVGAI